MRILLAEPSRIGRTIISGMLAEDGHEVICRESVEGALACLKEPEAGIDVVITAIEFAAMSGFELCWEARVLFEHDPLHIIVLSSSREEEKLTEALDCGADDFICKPPRKNELLARLRAASRLLVAQRELVRLARFDPLTGLRNRRSFFEELDRCRVDAGAASIIMLDVDHFKQVNDRYGHEAGDDVLREVGRRAAALDKGFSRLGGEEFALLARVPLYEAGGIAEVLRRTIGTQPFETSAGPMAVTVSIGVAERLAGASFDDTLKRADIALYAAKSAGRNRVSLARNASLLEPAPEVPASVHAAAGAQLALADFHLML